MLFRSQRDSHESGHSATLQFEREEKVFDRRGEVAGRGDGDFDFGGTRTGLAGGVFGTLGPDYSRPETAAAAAWNAPVPHQGSTRELAQWWAQFKDPALHLWKYDPSSLAPAMFGPGGRVPLKPFTGTIGVAPAEPGHHSIVPPRAVGGNMDIRDMAAGTELYLPVEVAGGLFSVGDTHACQGDGEV